jgi:hypothetical protein
LTFATCPSFSHPKLVASEEENAALNRSLAKLQADKTRLEAAAASQSDADDAGKLQKV